MTYGDLLLYDLIDQHIAVTHHGYLYAGLEGKAASCVHSTWIWDSSHITLE